MKIEIEASDALQLARLLDTVIDTRSSYYWSPPRGTKKFAREFRCRLEAAIQNPK